MKTIKSRKENEKIESRKEGNRIRELYYCDLKKLRSMVVDPAILKRGFHINYI